MTQMSSIRMISQKSPISPGLPPASQFYRGINLIASLGRAARHRRPSNASSRRSRFPESFEPLFLNPTNTRYHQQALPSKTFAARIVTIAHQPTRTRTSTNFNELYPPYWTLLPISSQSCSIPYVENKYLHVYYDVLLPFVQYDCSNPIFFHVGEDASHPLLLFPGRLFARRCPCQWSRCRRTQGSRRQALSGTRQTTPWHHPRFQRASAIMAVKKLCGVMLN